MKPCSGGRGVSRAATRRLPRSAARRGRSLSIYWQARPRNRAVANFLRRRYQVTSTCAGVTCAGEPAKFRMGDIPVRKHQETFDEEARILGFGFRVDGRVDDFLQRNTGQGGCQCRVLSLSLREDRRTRMRLLYARPMSIRLRRHWRLVRCKSHGRIGSPA